MGFPTIRCQKALLATGNSDADTAMSWLFEHMEDPGESPRFVFATSAATSFLLTGSDIDAPIPPPSGAASAAAGPEPSADQIAMISDMGFTSNQARKALRQTVSISVLPAAFLALRAVLKPVQDGNAERAIEWLFSNPDDQGEEPGTSTTAASSTAEAGKSTGPGGSSALPAQYRLKAFISHKGPSVHSGHYVTTIRQPQRDIPEVYGEEGRDGGADEDQWVLFNDEKVVKAPPGGGEEMRSLAYLYVYERV
jgi:ubiquitin carboxyl-terminal hydrolase 5/13